MLALFFMAGPEDDAAAVAVTTEGAGTFRFPRTVFIQAVLRALALLHVLL